MNYRYPLSYLSDSSPYFQALSELPWAMWLDSAGKDRYDILVAQPIATLTSKDKITTCCSSHSTHQSSDNPFDLLRHYLSEPLASETDLPFTGGAIGYWGYDLSSWPKADQADSSGIPDMAVGIYDWALLVDHLNKTAQLVSSLRYPETQAQLPSILQRLQACSNIQTEPFEVTSRITSNFTPASYTDAFNHVIDYLHAGDCYQVNLAQRFSAMAQGNPLAAYRYLRQICPAPFAAMIRLPDVQILCASPERFLRVQQGMVETKPIKGTRPRGKNDLQDAELLSDLQTNLKDRAENLMIVDLLRNDLGRCCEPGSIAVPELFKVETHANVHHLVSTITGKLSAEMDALNLLEQCFPGGSITGAPKKRAMEIIDELEPHRRGAYCGAIGYIGFDGRMDSNIIIRTLVYAAGEIHGWAGGGIVADSTAHSEFQETLDKASAIVQTLKFFGGKFS